jgi:hypothetical protein
MGSKTSKAERKRMNVSKYIIIENLEAVGEGTMDINDSIVTCYRPGPFRRLRRGDKFRILASNKSFPKAYQFKLISLGSVIWDGDGQIISIFCLRAIVRLFGSIPPGRFSVWVRVLKDGEASPELGQRARKI